MTPTLVPAARPAVSTCPALVARTRALLAAGVPLSLLLDLGEPAGPRSAELYAAEGGARRTGCGGGLSPGGQPCSSWLRRKSAVRCEAPRLPQPWPAPAMTLASTTPPRQPSQR